MFEHLNFTTSKQQNRMEIINEGEMDLVRQLAARPGVVTWRWLFCREVASEFRGNVLTHLPIVEAIKYSGVELPEKRQAELDNLSRLLREGVELTHKLLASKRWRVYDNLRLWKQMEKIEKEICRFIRFQADYIMADVQQMRMETATGSDSSGRSSHLMEQSLWDTRIGTGNASDGGPVEW